MGLISAWGGLGMRKLLLVVGLLLTSALQAEASTVSYNFWRR